MPKIIEFVLQDYLETNNRGVPVYLEKVTGIGTAYTEKITKAEKFKTLRDARQSPAYLDPMFFFEPVAVNDKS